MARTYYISRGVPPPGPRPKSPSNPRMPRITICAFAVTLLLLLPGTLPIDGRAALTQPVAGRAEVDESSRVLVFSRTAGWRHGSISDGIEAIAKLGASSGFSADFTEDAAAFNEGNLARYRAVVFLNTTGNVLNPTQQTAFERYIQAGGGFVGVHAAADTEYEWPWYGELVGAWFANHPNHPNVRPAAIDIVDASHPSAVHLPDRWERSDEWYSYRSFYPGINVIALLDEESYDGGTNGSFHPIAWYHAYDGGRAFYTGLGHTDESYAEPHFLAHLLGGIQYAMGEGGPLDYARARAVEKPEENRFMKTVLVNDLSVPMELAVADDGRIFYTELGGALGAYDPETETASVVHRFAVNRPGGSGLIGLTLDPDFLENGFIYLYYSPPSDAEEFDFRLSRFTISPQNALDASSEVILLTVPVSRNSGSHHGGSLAWDSSGNLILSTGDSTSPFPADGYAPLDERPGFEHEILDAQRSAANTNDLKGKILRIRPHQDGTYTIPDDNLFTPGTPKTRPEIYAMGMRNPYRIAVNPRTGAIYWGDIGPDAGEDSDRGPRGYDEFNVAKEPGFFGWPYFIGDNLPYADWDFTTESAGARFNPMAPVNDSPNNTGLRELPPAKPPFIWYPYAPYEVFPEWGEGGRSAMAGAFYEYDRNLTASGAFPDYYDGALFVFEWMRNLVRVVRVDEEDRYLFGESFMASNGDFRRPIDLTFGPDGAMYMLEYGSIYGVDNDDARLVKITYDEGNRPPVASARIRDRAVDSLAQARSWLTSDYDKHAQILREISGAAPLGVTFAGRGMDPDDGDALTYEWLFDGRSVGATRPFARHVYEQPGDYEPVLRVTDASGATDTDTLRVRVGNAPPSVTIAASNRTFFWDDIPFSYDVVVSDEEDGLVDAADVEVAYTYVSQPGLLQREARGDQLRTTSTAVRSWGETLIAGSDCRACHTVDAVAVGPSFMQIAERYAKQEGSPAFLAAKIIDGGGGNWGEVPMSAHPQISQEEAEEIVRYIFSLNEAQRAFTTIPARGSLALTDHEEREAQGRYVVTARYTDRGAPGAKPLTAEDVVMLRPATVRTVYADEHAGFPRWGNSLSGGKHKSHIMLRDVDLSDLAGFEYGYEAWGTPGEIELRIDSYAGPVVARTPYVLGSDTTSTALFTEPLTGRHDLYFIVRQPEPPHVEVMTLNSIRALRGD